VDAVFLDFKLFKLQRQGLAKIIYASRERRLAYTRQAHLLVLDDSSKTIPMSCRKW